MNNFTKGSALDVGGANLMGDWLSLRRSLFSDHEVLLVDSVAELMLDVIGIIKATIIKVHCHLKSR